MQLWVCTRESEDKFTVYPLCARLMLISPVLRVSHLISVICVVASE